MQRILSEHGATKGPTPGQSLVDLQIVKVDLPEIQEVDTIAIAKDKVLLAAQLAGGPCLVEDTSLQFTALGGMPGPYIKWFQDRLQCHGLYNILAAYQDKSATAVCTLAFCPAPHSDPVLFTGTCQGTIVAPVEGRGFGWDSIFVPTTKTGEMHHVPFSQMSIEEKNIYSHRGKAVRKWADWIGKSDKTLGTGWMTTPVFLLVFLFCFVESMNVMILLQCFSVACFFPPFFLCTTSIYTHAYIYIYTQRTLIIIVLLLLLSLLISCFHTQVIIETHCGTDKKERRIYLDTKGWTFE